VNCNLRSVNIYQVTKFVHSIKIQILQINKKIHKQTKQQQKLNEKRQTHWMHCVVRSTTDVIANWCPVHRTADSEDWGLTCSGSDAEHKDKKNVEMKWNHWNERPFLLLQLWDMICFIFNLTPLKTDHLIDGARWNQFTRRHFFSSATYGSDWLHVFANGSDWLHVFQMALNTDHLSQKRPSNLAFLNKWYCLLLQRDK
jgi:hypothetical protein